MQKVIGFLMIFAGCTGLGAWYGRRYREQVLALRQFCYILELFEGEVRYGRCLLAECCYLLAGRMEAPYKKCFLQIYEKMQENEGESFQKVCESYLWNGLKEVEAKVEDKALFIRCFSESGFQEDVLQLRMIEQGKNRLKDRLCAVEGEVASKYKLALGMGVMSGLLLIILLL